MNTLWMMFALTISVVLGLSAPEKDTIAKKEDGVRRLQGGTDTSDDDTTTSSSSGCARASTSSSTSSSSGCEAAPVYVSNLYCGPGYGVGYFATSSPVKDPVPKSGPYSGSYEDFMTDEKDINCVDFCNTQAKQQCKDLYAAETYTYFRGYGEGSCDKFADGNCGDVCFCFEESECSVACTSSDTGMMGQDGFAVMYTGTTFVKGQLPTRVVSWNDC